MTTLATVAFSGTWSTADNVTAICDLASDAASRQADLVVFPELALHGYRVSPDVNPEILKEIYRQAERVPDGSNVETISTLARQLGIHIVYGLHERGERPGEIYNTAVLTGPAGHIGAYRKVHLAVTERSVWQRGDTWPVFDTELGRIGLQICYDKVWAESARELTLRGADILVVPAAWPIHRDYYETYDKVRAMENSRWLISSNWTGQLGGVDYFGVAQIVDPRGRTVASTGVCTSVELCVATVDIPGGIEDALVNFGGSRMRRDRQPATYTRIAATAVHSPAD
jgi:predicted amidohydrolase